MYGGVIHGVLVFHFAVSCFSNTPSNIVHVPRNSAAGTFVFFQIYISWGHIFKIFVASVL